MARSNGRSSARFAPDEGEPPPRGARRFCIVATSSGGLALGWAALRLPWRPEAPLALLLWLLAAANLCSAIALLLDGRAHGGGGLSVHARRALRWLVALSLGAAPVLVGAIAVTSFAMVRMYGALGWGLTAALLAIAWLVLLLTLPVALVGIQLLRPARGRSA